MTESNNALLGSRNEGIECFRISQNTFQALSVSTLHIIGGFE